MITSRRTPSLLDGTRTPYKCAKGKLGSAASENQIESIISNECCNVVLTHVNADFDTLAGAVALAKLWSIERPSLATHVVMPRGVNPLVSRFLAYHKHLLPVRGFVYSKAPHER